MPKAGEEAVVLLGVEFRNIRRQPEDYSLYRGSRLCMSQVIQARLIT